MRFLRIGLLCVAAISSSFYSIARADTQFEPLLNTVMLQFNAEQWVTSKTALVTAGINAGTSDQGLERIQNDVLTKLSQISNKGAWHIVSFNRSLDQSGLERIQMSAEVRLNASDLGGLRDKARAISKPGETFTIDDVEFTPSPTEMRDANTMLRNDIYQQVNAELSALNKAYPDQKFYLHTVNFMNEIVPQPQPMMYAKVAQAGAGASAESALSVGNKMKLSATVVLAAAPGADVVKMLHD